MSISSTINDAGSFHSGDVRVHSAVLRSNRCTHGIFQRNRRLHHVSLLAASVALFAAMPAFAQDAAQDCNVEPNDCIVVADMKTPPDIVVAAGVPQYAGQIGQAVTIITRAEIEQRQTVSISDLLATTPGITVSRNGGPGGLTGVRIRGAEAEQTLTLIDGVRVNDPSSPGGGFDFGNLLAGSVERIEVLRGANSVPWGSQALGGVVNIVTSTPTEGLQGRGSVEYGSHDTVFANAGVSGGKGAVTASLTGGYLRTDGVSSAAIGTEPDGYRQYGGTGSVNIAFTGSICAVVMRTAASRSTAIRHPTTSPSRTRRNIPPRRKSMAMPASMRTCSTAGSATRSPSPSPI
jgi:outer membrane cobalamin receptor